MFNRPIHIGLSPNTSIDDFLLTLKTLLRPWKWKKGKTIEKVENWFKDYFQATDVFTFNAGRSALLAILKSLEMPQDSEVMLQAFTCVAVPNAVIWAGYKPIYVDIDSSLNIDITDAEKKLTTRTKAIIVQHTFGIPADMEKITAFCNKHHLVLVEDCAHALGATYKGKLIGTFGDAAFFSFGRDKIISSVFGGAAIINSKFKIQNLKLREFHEKLGYPSYFWILQQILHPLVSAVALSLYSTFNIGKGILWFFQKLKLISFPVFPEEKKGKKPECFPKKFSNALAELALHQLQKLESLNVRRKQNSQQYFSKLRDSHFKLPDKQSGAIYLRFNILTSRADEIRFQAKKQGIILGNWYKNIIDPQGTDLGKIGYKIGSCPRAEKEARGSLNLPTYPFLTNSQTKQVIDLLHKYEESVAT